MSTTDNCFCVIPPFCLDVKSIAPPVILSRTLQHHRELGLSDDQVRRLLAVARRYHDRTLRVSVDFANISAQLDLIEVRPDLRVKRRLLARHARLFQRHEGLLLEAHEEAARILSAEQRRRVGQIHAEQRHAILRRLRPGLQRGLGPSLKVVSAGRRSRKRR